MELAFLVTFVVAVQGGFLNPLSMESHQPTLVLVVDTDGGIDDALALLLLLSSYDKTPILSVTCVFGNTDLRNACDNVLRVLALADRKEIPVHKGSTGPLTTGKYVPKLVYVLGVDGLANRSHEFPTSGQQFSGISAALALSQVSRLNPGAVTLLAIGPLTNLALAHRIDPHFTHNLREIVIMGGNYNGFASFPPEFNFEADPLSANIILNEAACPLTLFPYETAFKNGIPWDTLPELDRIETRFGHFFKRVSSVQRTREREWGDPSYLVYDFVAAAIVLYPEIITAEEKRTLMVEYEEQFTRGTTVVLPDANGRKQVRIVTDVNGTAIVELFRRLLNTL